MYVQSLRTSKCQKLSAEPNYDIESQPINRKSIVNIWKNYASDTKSLVTVNLSISIRLKVDSFQIRTHYVIITVSHLIS